MEEVFHTLKRQLTAYACRFVGRTTAEELAQETLITLWRHLETSGKDPDEVLVPRFAFRILRRAIMNTWRDARTEEAAHGKMEREHLTAGNTPPSPLEQVERSDLTARVDEAAEQLPPKQRETFFLFRQQGMKAEEIAQVMGIASGAARANLGRAFKAIRATLKPVLAELDESPHDRSTAR